VTRAKKPRGRGVIPGPKARVSNPEGDYRYRFFRAPQLTRSIGTGSQLVWVQSPSCQTPPTVPHTAYSAAKFAVKGFTEALIGDLRVNAPHVKVAVVMPGHIGTSIVLNTNKVLGKPDIEAMAPADVLRLRDLLMQRGLPVGEMSDDEIRTAMQQMAIMFRDNAPTTAAQAATIILDGVRNEAWRILVGEDAHVLDRLVRAAPEAAYEESFMDVVRAEGHMQFVG